MLKRTRQALLALAASMALLTIASQLATADKPDSDGNSSNPVPLIKNPHPNAVALLHRLTLKEKAHMVTGVGMNSPDNCGGAIAPIPRLNFTGICVRDATSGVHAANASTVSAFPNPITFGATWDRDLVRRGTEAIGQEFWGTGTEVMSSPVVGAPLGRSAFNGRIFENYGNDPVLAGEMGVEAIQGIQSQGVVATVKHFLVYEQETFRGGHVVLPGVSENLPVDFLVDDRTLHELYVWPLADTVVRANTSAVMCSYNRINGEHASSSSLLHTLLKGELDFQGYVMSDWDSIWKTENSIMNGLDVDFPGGELESLSNNSDSLNDTAMNPVSSLFGGHIPNTPVASSSNMGDMSKLNGTHLWGQALVDLINEGRVAESRLDDAILRFLTPYYELEQDTLMPSYNKTVNTDVRGDHYKIIQEVGQDANTLLKNEGSALPLKLGGTSGTKVLGVFGFDAAFPKADRIACEGLTMGRCSSTFPSNYTVFSGLGSGSSEAHDAYVVDPITAIEDYVKQYNDNKSTDVSIVPYLDNDVTNESFNTTVEVCDTALVFVSLQSTEGLDLPYLHPDGEGMELVKQVADRVKNTIVIVHSTNQMVLTEAAQHPNVTAILMAYAPGEQTGNALTPVLFGDVSPSGKLPWTLAKDENDFIHPLTDASVAANPQVNVTEKLLLDYRRFDKLNIEPLYPFGFGLSYTTFEYGNVSVPTIPPQLSQSSTNATPTADPALYEPIVTVTVPVTNTGSWPKPASEAVQVYVAYPESAGEPFKVLRGFAKAKNVAPGETKSVDIHLSQKSFSIYDTTLKGWVVPSGTYKILVAASSRDIRQTYEFEV